MAGKITAFYKGLTTVCTPGQDGVANPEIVYFFPGFLHVFQ